jgi:hypothetical protein
MIDFMIFLFYKTNRLPNRTNVPTILEALVITLIKMDAFYMFVQFTNNFHSGPSV